MWICPECGYEINTDDVTPDDILDMEFEGDYISVIYLWSCPSCGEAIHFKDSYSFTGETEMVE